MSKELVSIIMPTFNAGRFLSASIDSILAQTYQQWELLITDDDSTDPLTLSLLKEYAEKDQRIKVEYLKENNGPGVARNKSIERARGRYIAFCDSDDRWMPEKLERQLQLMEEKQCALCYSSYIICDAEGRETGIFIAPEKLTLETLKHDNKIGCLTAVYDSRLLGRKFYMPSLRKRQDWALFLSILKAASPAYALTQPLAYYRQRSHSVSSNKLALIKYNVKVYETVLNFPKWKAYAYFFFVFLPCYYMKVIRRSIDSCRFIASSHNKTNTTSV
jgi:glycosyltransferase involved in cell wall biosynthesis